MQVQAHDTAVGLYRLDDMTDQPQVYSWIHNQLLHQTQQQRQFVLLQLGCTCVTYTPRVYICYLHSKLDFIMSRSSTLSWAILPSVGNWVGTVVGWGLSSIGWSPVADECSPWSPKSFLSTGVGSVNVSVSVTIQCVKMCLHDEIIWI